jgi:hypothetical protein
MIKSHPMKDVDLFPQGTGAFLQFTLTVNIDGELQTILGWGHPQLINLLKNGKVHLFVDCTFKVVPKGFTQLMILMMYYPGTEMYVPVFFVLLQSKKANVYYHALQQCICASDWKLEAMTFTSDFEQAIMGELKHHFPEGVGIFACSIYASSVEETQGIWDPSCPDYCFDWSRRRYEDTYRNPYS